ncbi:MAG TPA: class IV adenylate cyclase [Candidatus Binataceae bacterium]|jgi:predicted adenylyl cyclase CyaB|nr:class IV adenylate cyclase [Candidatus Binataceae bacterium]
MENVEIKARCPDLAAMSRAVGAAGAVFERSIEQIDTYFTARNGRLKLRREDGVDRSLIFYRRPDDSSPKVSSYDLMTIAPHQHVGSLLEQALGIKIVVRKRRQLWRLDNIRIHLDEVEGLGAFIEFEVEVLPGRDVPGCRIQAEELLRRLGIPEANLLAGSYSDLML